LPPLLIFAHYFDAARARDAMLILLLLPMPLIAIMMRRRHFAIIDIAAA